MKNSFKLGALFLLLGTGAFAKAPAHIKDHYGKLPDKVSIIPLKLKSGFAVMVDKQNPGKSTVLIMDNDDNVVYKGALVKNNVRAEKKYILSQLDNGNYTLEVYSKGHELKTRFSVYNKGDRKIVDFI